jgi:hypothetical protein
MCWFLIRVSSVLQTIKIFAARAVFLSGGR